MLSFNSNRLNIASFRCNPNLGDSWRVVPVEYDDLNRGSGGGRYDDAVVDVPKKSSSSSSSSLSSSLLLLFPIRSGKGLFLDNRVPNIDDGPVVFVVVAA